MDDDDDDDDDVDDDDETKAFVSGKIWLDEPSIQPIISSKSRINAGIWQRNNAELPAVTNSS